MQKEYSPAEVIDELKILTGETTDTGVAEQLGIGKQNINQFKKGKQQDVKMKIIALLLEELKSRNS